MAIEECAEGRKSGIVAELESLENAVKDLQEEVTKLPQRLLLILKNESAKKSIEEVKPPCSDSNAFPVIQKLYQLRGTVQKISREIDELFKRAEMKGRTNGGMLKSIGEIT